MIELKEHNQKPYAELKKMLNRFDRCAYISATGTGKTYIGSKFIEEESFNPLILVPSIEIMKTWKSILPKVRVETYYGIHKADLTGVDLLICDEMHHLGAETWGANFQNLISGFSGKILGLTATPIRFLDKGRNMVDELFDGNQVIGLELPEAIEKRMLPTFDYITALYNLPDYIPKSEYRNETTEKLYNRLDILSNEYSLQNILLKHIPKGSHKVVVFVNRIEEIPSMMGILKVAFPLAEHSQVHSLMIESERKKVMRDFQFSQNLSFLYTVDLLNEGVHIPGVDTVIMFRRTQSPNVYLQQLGRALSTDMKDKRVQIYDFVANHDNLKTCLGAGTRIIDWIKKEVKNPNRQVIVTDYAVEEWDLIRKIRDQVFRLWDAPEKRAKFYQDVRTYFPQENGLDHLQEMYPDLRRNYISCVANQLGLVEKAIPRLSEDAKAFIAEHPEMNTKEIQNIFPSFTISQIRAYRYKLGLYDKKIVWTAEMDSAIMDHIDLSAPELQKQFFPDLKEAAVRHRKKVLGWSAPKKDVWDEEKVKRFSDLYVHGGTRWVQQDPEFAGMSSNYVAGKAERLRLKRGGRPINFNWSREETLILENELRKPWEQRLSFAEIAAKMPRHTPLAVKRRMKRMMDKKDTWF